MVSGSWLSCCLVDWPSDWMKKKKDFWVVLENEGEDVFSKKKKRIKRDKETEEIKQNNQYCIGDCFGLVREMKIFGTDQYRYNISKLSLYICEYYIYIKLGPSIALLKD